VRGFGSFRIKLHRPNPLNLSFSPLGRRDAARTMRHRRHGAKGVVRGQPKSRTPAPLPPSTVAGTTATVQIDPNPKSSGRQIPMPAISRRAPGRVRGDAQWRAARCCSRCRDDNWSRAIRNSQNRNRDDRRDIDPLAPMKPRSRSTAAPLPRQVLLHSWLYLLEVGFNYPHGCHRLAALFIPSGHSRDLA
jgi:hypothetical protein